MMELSFLNRNVLVTGATRGIGKSIAEQFELAGANLILTGTDPNIVKNLNEELGTPNKKYFVLDMKNEESIESFTNELDNYNNIDVCINNAGINIIDDFVNTVDEDFEEMLNVNLKGPYKLNKYCAAKMIQNKYGRIINICSIWSVITRPKRSLYTITKNALHGLTKTMAVELGQYNILVNSLSPGFTLTELTLRTNSADEIKNIETRIPIGRMAQPQEIAKIALFIASDLNTYLTGQNIIIDGGFVIV